MIEIEVYLRREQKITKKLEIKHDVIIMVMIETFCIVVDCHATGGLAICTSYAIHNIIIIVISYTTLSLLRIIITFLVMHR